MSKRLITDFFDAPKGGTKRHLHGTVDGIQLPSKDDSVTSSSEDNTTITSPVKDSDITSSAKDSATTSPSNDATNTSASADTISTVEKLLGDEWASKLSDEIRKPYFGRLWNLVAKDRKTKKVYPPEHLVFNAFKLVPLSKVKVVIVGQDPYHQPRQAMGLSFSVPRGVAIPPSLRNIFKEIGIERSHGDLTYWAQQGVFLLNTVLTVIDSQPFSHKDYGWSTFTDVVIELINRHCEHVVFLLWGKPAQKKCDSISPSRHCILKCGHPSPLSQRFFVGCDHFNKCNDYLRQTNQSPIDWMLP
ncbi:uracil-DNA glycosylase [Babesia ovis]|uniref:Uracil-DNA glycosylase n=1 Tax=Babesia ovis TaxID=5869 RepID=A0A9W5T8P7_BABOV|nr:uracil-DNA glycosylase [Babesia ovis]